MSAPAEVPRRPHVVVVGAGVAGLAAALALLDSPRPPRVTVVEASGRVGGKLLVGQVGGVVLDAGAESLLARRPEALALARAVGLGADIVHPAAHGAGVWLGDRVRPLPAGQLMGVPTDLAALAASGVLSLPGLARVPLDHVLPATRVDADVAVGRYVSARLGREVTDRLVEPLLGGVYAGHADELSMQAVLPQLAAAVRGERSLLNAARGVQAGALRDADRPVFAGLRGGVGRLPLAVADAVVGRGGRLRLDCPARELRRTVHGWELAVGDASTSQTLAADAVVLALPGAPAARLLRELVAHVAAELAAVEYASVALVALAVPAAALPPMAGTGFLVPPVSGRLIKAVTYASAKWAWVAQGGGDVAVLRCSVGRHGEEADLQRDDADLAAAAIAEVSAATGLAAPVLDWVVTRWGGGLPQYAVGHLGRVERVRAGLAAHPSLALAGAALDGVGIAACVASGQRAAAHVAHALAAGGD